MKETKHTLSEEQLNAVIGGTENAEAATKYTVGQTVYATPSGAQLPHIGTVRRIHYDEADSRWSYYVELHTDGSTRKFREEELSDADSAIASLLARG